MSNAVFIASSAALAQIRVLQEAVERNCPVLNLLRQPQAIAGEVNVKSNPTPSEGFP